MGRDPSLHNKLIMIQNEKFYQFGQRDHITLKLNNLTLHLKIFSSEYLHNLKICFKFDPLVKPFS